MKIETNKEKSINTHTHTNSLQLNIILLNNQWITKKSGLGLKKKKYLETIANKNTIPKSVWCNKTTSKRKLYSNKGLPYETRKIQNTQPKFIPKGTTKARKPKVNSRK